jgi:hypothetical protein
MNDENTNVTIRSLQQALKAHSVVRREAPTFSLDKRHTNGGEVVSLTRRLPINPSGWFLVFISVRGWVDPMAIVQLKG